MVDDHNQLVLEALLQYSNDELHSALTSIPWNIAQDHEPSVQEIPTANIAIHSFGGTIGMSRVELDELSKKYDSLMEWPIAAGKKQLPNGLTFYTLENGRNRTVVARYRGWKTISANVKGTSQLLPEQLFFVIGSDGTYVADKSNPNFWSSQPISKTREAVMRLMGVVDTVDVKGITDSLSDRELFLLWKNGDGFAEDPRKLRIYSKVKDLYSYGYTYNTRFGESIGMHDDVLSVFHKIACQRRDAHVPGPIERFLLWRDGSYI